MLDKTLPYYNIIMKRKAGTPLPEASLHQDFQFKGYTPGDETAWACIMTDVGEFDSQEEALDYFEKEYYPYMDEVKRRMLFVETQNGEKVGTLTIWWRYTGEKRNPTLEWVGVKPCYQGKGIGKALSVEGMKRMIRMEDDRDFFLHTQTWSYKAVNIYESMGYEMVKDEVFSDYDNDYEKALEILKDYRRF